MQQLVSSWVEAQKNGYRRTLGVAIRDLNKVCGTKLTYSRLAEWRRGKYTLAVRSGSRVDGALARTF